jgi:hypothetical protein
MWIRAIIPLLLLQIIIMFSGCTEPNFGPGGPYCSVIGNCQVDEGPAEVIDIVSFQEIKVLPATSSFRPGTKIDVIVTLRNMLPDEKVDLSYIGIADMGIFKCAEGSECSYEGQQLAPSQIRTFAFSIIAPDNIGSMAIDSNIEVATIYSYGASRLTTISFVERETYIGYLNAGGKVPTHIVNKPSSGPVELSLDISNLEQPLLHDTENERTYQVFLSVINKGGGVINRISAGNLTLEFEKDSGSDAPMEFEDCSDIFEACSGQSIASSKEIRLLGKVPHKYYLSFKPTGGISFTDARPIYTAKISSKASYTYRIGKTQTIRVSPRSNI